MVILLDWMFLMAVKREVIKGLEKCWNCVVASLWCRFVTETMCDCVLEMRFVSFYCYKLSNNSVLSGFLECGSVCCWSFYRYGTKYLFRNAFYSDLKKTWICTQVPIFQKCLKQKSRRNLSQNDFSKSHY